MSDPSAPPHMVQTTLDLPITLHKAYREPS